MSTPSYPIPAAHTQDWEGLITMFKGMAEEAQMRGDEIRALDDPTDLARREAAKATASAYCFAALMIQMTV